MREYALMILKFEGLYNAVFENKVMHYFLRFIPSLQELVLLGKILFHLKEKRSDGSYRFEKIIVDSPATGHAITFYSVPQVIIDTVPPGTMANEATWMRDFVIDPAVTAVVLVSLPEELPVNETLELCATLTDKVKMHPRLVVLNAWVEPRFTNEELESLPEPLKASMEAYTAQAAQSLGSRERLATLGLPVVTVPRLFGEQFGRAAIEKIALQFGPLPAPAPVIPVTP
jgi:anion-transporting  ArsA/GET3 family ATPase